MLHNLIIDCIFIFDTLDLYPIFNCISTVILFRTEFNCILCYFIILMRKEIYSMYVGTIHLLIKIISCVLGSLRVIKT